MLGEEVKHANSLQEDMITHGSHSSLVGCVAELKYPLKVAEEQYKFTSTSVKEKVR